MPSSVTPLHDHLIRRLADEFFRIMGDLSTPEEITALLQRHQHYPIQSCDSPDFTPAGLALTQAFKTVMRRWPRLSVTSDQALLSASWSRIKALKPSAHTERSLSQVSTNVSGPEFRVQGLHPNPYVWHTGGGCFALRLDCADAGYLLITDAECSDVPKPDATEVRLSRYAANGDVVDEPALVPISDLRRAVAAALNRASFPTNVADYFVKTLGAGHIDLTLRDVALASRCGQDCSGVIDSAAALVERCRGTRSKGRPVLEWHVIDLARRLVCQVGRGHGGR